MSRSEYSRPPPTREAFPLTRERANRWRESGVGQTRRSMDGLNGEETLGRRSG